MPGLHSQLGKRGKVPAFGDIDRNTTIGNLMTEYNLNEEKCVTITGPIAEEAAQNQYLDYGSDNETGRPEVEIDVERMMDLTKFRVAKTSYVAYGNEALLDYVLAFSLQI
jgi:hypothetical protein